VVPPAPKKILVVDDDESQANLIATYLRKHHFQVVTASDPIAAMQTLQTVGNVDLVITDLMMPHVDGIAFTEKLKKWPGMQDVPVILITAWDSDEVADKGMRKGVAMTLSKPVQLSKLLDLVGFATSK
jgi:two-component system, chemotaxis family, chemotaxis protein CheY